MSKAEQVLILDPPTELHFKGTFTSIVTSTLKLNNPSEQRVCFKVKTTAPKQYCVRPNSGIIEAKKSVEVAVMLQPFEYNPSEKNKHKFMVQSLFAPDGDFSQDALWRDATPDSLMDSKLRCVFEAVSDPASNGQNTGESGNSVISSETSKNDLQTAPVKSSPKQVSGTERRKVMENEALKAENVQETDGKESSLRQRQRTSDSGPIGSSRISKVAAGEEVIRPIQKQHQQMSQPQAASGAHHHHPTVSYPDQAGGLSQLQNPVVMAVLVLSLVLGVLVGKFVL